MLKKLLTLVLATAALPVVALPTDAVCPDWRGHVPEPVFPDSALIELYHQAWDIAAGRVRTGPDGMVASPYLDENCYEDQIWIWDSCFMVMFSKYCPELFPGKETLMNLYAPIHDRGPSPLRIHLRDNPPLFAWTELQNHVFTGDSARIDYLKRHYDYFNSLERGNREPAVSPNPIFLKVHRDSLGQADGYTWNGNASGMDNTVRGRGAGGWDGIRWVDAISQQALAAKCIYALTGEAEWHNEYNRLKDIVNRNYWDERDGFYYDIDTVSGAPCRVMTVASFWPMLAGIPDSIRAARMVEKVMSPEHFGGERPWASMSHSDPDFDTANRGNYWRGGIWLPMAYMGTNALEEYGYYELADSLARKVVELQARVYRTYEPHTIWETYSPVSDEPSTEHGHTVRPEFCGWSALGPISLFIENILGFRHADAINRTLTWDLNQAKGRHGIRNLRFGPVNTTLIYDSGKITVESNTPYTLILNGTPVEIKEGQQTLTFLLN